MQTNLILIYLFGYQIWRRWKGTVFRESWPSCIRNMIIATIVAFVFESKPILKTKLVGFNILWGQLLSITTFTLTFFLNTSYGLWRKCYELSRRLQGRLNDLGLTMAAHADRIKPSNPDEPGTYTPAARQVLELMARYIRVFNLLTYASFTRSHRPILTPRGMRRLVDRGLLTPTERKILLDAEVPATQRHNNMLLWIVRVFIEARAAGHIIGGSGFEQQFMEKVHVIRAQYGAIGDELQGRMPLAYAHIVQVLVDAVLWMYPFMAFTSNNMSAWLGIFSTGMLTIFYQGLFDLAKQFLDPYDNENFGQGDDPLCVDTLVAETNAGSVRWLSGVAEIPFNTDKLKEGEMKDYILPLRGYSVEQLLEMEEEEKLEQQRKEEERQRKEEEEKKKKEKAQAEKEKEEKAQAEKNKLLQTEPDIVSLSNVTKNEVLSPNLTVSNSTSLSMKSNETEKVPIPKTIDVTKKLEKADRMEEIKPKKLDTIENKNGDEKKSKMVTALFPVTEMPPITLQNETTNNSVVTIEKQVVNGNGNLLPTAVNKKVTILEEDDNIDEEEELFFSRIAAGLEDFDWYEQIDDDGNEMRLSQMLADEEWEEELENGNDMDDGKQTFEQMSEQAKGIIQAAKKEFLETKAILNAAPGDTTALETESKEDDKDTFESETFKSGIGGNSRKPNISKGKKENDKQMKKKPGYDQTKLDSLSQLWGAGPGDLEGITERNFNETVIPLDALKMESFSQLWSDSSTPIVSPAATSESSADTREVSSAGISQLWGDVSPQNSFENETEEGIEWVSPESSFDDLEWFNEVGPDGNELRLSQMLADEVWEEEIKIEPPTVETFEDFSKKAIEDFEAYADEMLETEAILNAAPGFQSLGEEFEDDEEDEDESEVVFPEAISEIESSEEECISNAILDAAPGSQSLDLEKLCSEQQESGKEIPDDSLNVFEMDVDPSIEVMKKVTEKDDLTDLMNPKSVGENVNATQIYLNGQNTKAEDNLETPSMNEEGDIKTSQSKSIDNSTHDISKGDLDID